MFVCELQRTISNEGRTLSDTAEKKECFVVSPIGEAGSATRKHADMVLNSKVRPVATSPEFDFHVSRADEISDPGMINDQVINKITSAPLVVADLSFLNPNVFYEIRLRHATGKPIIHLASTETKLPFDTLGYRCLGFDISDWAFSRRDPDGFSRGHPGYAGSQLSCQQPPNAGESGNGVV